MDRQALIRIAVELNGLAVEEKTGKTMCWRIDETFESKLKSQEVDMCQNCCQQPDKLMDKPETCTPEQIRQCHGDTGVHSCTKENCAPVHK